MKGKKKPNVLFSEHLTGVVNGGAGVRSRWLCPSVAR